MKKLFGNRKNQKEQWDSYDEEENYDWDDMDAADAEEDADAYYAEEEFAYEDAGAAAYADEKVELEYEAEYDAADGTYATEEEAYYGDEGAEAEYYEAEDTEPEYSEYDGEADPYYEEAGYEEGYEAEYEAGYEAEYESEYEAEYYEEEPAYEEPAVAYAKRPSKTQRNQEERRNPFAVLWSKIVNMTAIDRAITITGVAVLVLALVTGSVYISARMVNEQINSFADVGNALEGIELIGEQGLLAVANARQSMLEAAEIVEEEQKDYDEAEFSKNVTVELNMTSIQKDLKIKFVNKNTGKLVANVPFEVTITTPGNKTETWNDDDMDGIIYKKDITPGTYKVAVTALTDEKYADYTLPTATESVEVRKDIAYQKVDVAAEVKTEAEVNATKEDTKVNETVVESTLQDTVEWVESTSTANTYVEVAKSNVVDPTTLVKSGSFLRAAASSSISASTASVEVGQTTSLSATITGGELQSINWNTDNATIASVTGNGTSATVTGVAVGTTTIRYSAVVRVTEETPEATPTPTPTTDSSGNQLNPSPDTSPTPTTKDETVTGTCTITVTAAALPKGSVSVNPASMSVAIKGTATAQATMSGFATTSATSYSIASSNTAIATAAIDGTGKITVTGVAAGDATVTVTANYTGGAATTAATATIAVKVAGTVGVTLNQTTATAYIGDPLTITATITGTTNTTTAVTAISSDTTVATVAVSGRTVTVTGLKVGTATITIQYTEGSTVEGKCTVTVKNNPKNDKTSKLKDTSGNQLYVLEGSTYREAVYADYYTASKFYLKGSIKYTGWQTLDGKVYFFKADGTKVTGEQVIQGAKYTFASDGSLVTGSGTMGIDVSKWNGSIDWNAVKNSGVSYVIIRCGYRGSSQGALIEDPKYATNIKGATAAGLKVGVYFFTQAVDEREAVEEASMVLQLVKNYKISYPIFLDVESSGGRADNISSSTRTAVVKAFCQTIQNAGYTAGVYANKTWLTSKMDAGALSAYKIWLAQYAATPTYTGRYDLWQYKSNGKVSGISGSVDMNLSYLGY